MQVTALHEDVLAVVTPVSSGSMLELSKFVRSDWRTKQTRHANVPAPHSVRSTCSSHLVTRIAAIAGALVIVLQDKTFQSLMENIIDQFRAVAAFTAFTVNAHLLCVLCCSMDKANRSASPELLYTYIQTIGVIRRDLLACTIASRVLLGCAACAVKRRVCAWAST